MDLHYGRDDFASQDRLVRTLSRDRPKDMASDYEHRDPAQNYAERRGITFRERVAEIVRRVVPERVRNMFDGLRPSDEALPGTGGARRPQREAPARKVVEDPEAVLRKARTKALIRHARAVNAIVDMQEQGGKASPEQMKELQEARKVFEEVRPYGSHDAEAAYKKNPELALEAASGNSAAPSARSSLKPNCAPIRAAAPTVSCSAGRSSTTPASTSIRRATCLATGRRARRWATWRKALNAIRNWSPSSPTASRNSASHLNQAAGSARNWPSLTASTLAEARASEFDPSICRALYATLR